MFAELSSRVNETLTYLSGMRTGNCLEYKYLGLPVNTTLIYSCSQKFLLT